MAGRPIIRVTRPIPPIGPRAFQARNSPFYQLELRAWLRGIRGSSRVWLAVGITLWGARLVRKMGSREERIVATEVLKPGQRVIITALLPEPKRGRR